MDFIHNKPKIACIQNGERKSNEMNRTKERMNARKEEGRAMEEILNE